MLCGPRNVIMGYDQGEWDMVTRERCGSGEFCTWTCSSCSLMEVMWLGELLNH